MSIISLCWNSQGPGRSCEHSDSYSAHSPLAIGPSVMGRGVFLGGLAWGPVTAALEQVGSGLAFSFSDQHQYSRRFLPDPWLTGILKDEDGANAHDTAQESISLLASFT